MTAVVAKPPSPAVSAVAAGAATAAGFPVKRVGLVVILVWMLSRNFGHYKYGHCGPQLWQDPIGVVNELVNGNMTQKRLEYHQLQSQVEQLEKNYLGIEQQMTQRSNNNLAKTDTTYVNTLKELTALEQQRQDAVDGFPKQLLDVKQKHEASRNDLEKEKKSLSTKDTQLHKVLEMYRQILHYQQEIQHLQKEEDEKDDNEDKDDAEKDDDEDDEKKKDKDDGDDDGDDDETDDEKKAEDDKDKAADDDDNDDKEEKKKTDNEADDDDDKAKTAAAVVDKKKVIKGKILGGADDTADNDGDDNNDNDKDEKKKKSNDDNDADTANGEEKKKKKDDDDDAETADTDEKTHDNDKKKKKKDDDEEEEAAEKKTGDADDDDEKKKTDDDDKDEKAGGKDKKANDAAEKKNDTEKADDDDDDNDKDDAKAHDDNKDDAKAHDDAKDDEKADDGKDAKPDDDDDNDDDKDEKKTTTTNDKKEDGDDDEKDKDPKDVVVVVGADVENTVIPADSNNNSVGAVPPTTPVDRITVEDIKKRKVMNMGLPQIGNGQIYDYFRGPNKVFNMPPSAVGGNKRSMGMCIREEVNKDPNVWQSCGDFDVFPMLDFWNEKKKLCALPQISLLEELHQDAKDAIWILPYHSKPFHWVDVITSPMNPDDKGKGVSGADRLAYAKDCKPHGPKSSNEQDLLAWNEEHMQRIRNFVAQHPTHTLIEIDVEKQSSGKILEYIFEGTSAEFWKPFQPTQPNPFQNYYMQFPESSSSLNVYNKLSTFLFAQPEWNKMPKPKRFTICDPTNQDPKLFAEKFPKEKKGKSVLPCKIWAGSAASYPDRAEQVFTTVQDPRADVVKLYKNCQAEQKDKDKMPTLDQWLQAWIADEETTATKDHRLCEDPRLSRAFTANTPTKKGQPVIKKPLLQAEQMGFYNLTTSGVNIDVLKDKFTVLGDAARPLQTACAIFMRFTKWVPAECKCTPPPTPAEDDEEEGTAEKRHLRLRQRRRHLEGDNAADNVPPVSITTEQDELIAQLFGDDAFLYNAAQNIFTLQLEELQQEFDMVFCKG